MKKIFVSLVFIIIVTGCTPSSKQSVENQPSKTAMGTASLRALAVVDEREEIRGHDYLAEIFLPENMRKTFFKKVPGIVRWITNYRMPGMYEYIIARTAFFDNIVKKALRENIPQIVFLGAGYDSRPYRFKDLIKDTKIFELDIHTTQQEKIKLLKQNNIPIPKQLTFVSINFNTETLEDALVKAGYKKDKKSLFVWEGVTHYLLPKAVNDTFKFIKLNTATGSTVCFDYKANWPEMNNAYGVKKIMETMEKDYSGEPVTFGIKRGEIQPFLTSRGFKIIEHLTAEEIEKKYLTLSDGTLAGKVIAFFCFTNASVSR